MRSLPLEIVSQHDAHSFKMFYLNKFHHSKKGETSRKVFQPWFKTTNHS